MVAKQATVNAKVIQKLRRQLKREQPAERRDTIRVDPELDEAIEAYVSEINKSSATKMDRGKLWRLAAREYLGLTPAPKEVAHPSVQYVPIEEMGLPA